MTRLITVPLNRPNGHDPVIYRASLAASGFDEWVFTHRNYPAGPWLLLNRQSLRDDTLDQLLIDRWSWSSDGMERTLRELYSRFHLDPSRVGSVRFGNDAGPIRQAITISDLKVYRYRPKTGENIADPRHRIWASDIAYNTHKQGTALYERDAIIGGLGSVLKARWERFGIYNEVFYSYSLTGRNLIRMGAFFTGVHEGATQLLKALGDMGSLVITLVDGAIDASLTFAGHLAAGDTEAIINGAVKAGLSVANGIDGVKRALQEAYELLQLVLSTPDIGYALYCYLDGLLESIPHTDKFKLAGQAGFAIGLEVLLFFASGGIANVARWVGQGVTKTANTARMLNKSDFLGPFPMQTLESMLNYARLKKAGKLTGNSEPPVIPIKVGDQKTITGGVNDTQKLASQQGITSKSTHSHSAENKKERNNCNHSWISIKMPSINEAIKENEKLINGMKNKSSMKEVMRGYEFENKAIRDNLKKMNLLSASAKYKCTKCGADQEVDVVGERQIGEAKSSNKKQYSKKGMQRRSLKDIQEKLFDATKKPRAKLDANHKDYEMVREKYARSGFETEAVY